MSAFIILIVLHLIGDFYLQSSKIAQCKNAKIDEKCNPCIECKEKSRFNFKYVLIHSLIYTIPFLALFCFTKPGKAALIILFSLTTHCVVDLITCCVNKKWKQTLTFLLDQAIHIVILYCCCRIAKFYSLSSDYEFLTNLIKISFLALLTMTPASVLISKLFCDVFNESGQKSSEFEQKGVFDTGSIIGIFERILVIILAYFNSFAAIAIIITIKTWARSEDLKESKFRNKYLLGTLASLVWALLSYALYSQM